MPVGRLLHSLPDPVKRSIKDTVYPKLLAEGEIAPEWHLQSFDGTWWRHNPKRWHVMVFYPGDDTPGCTAQLQDFQEHLQQVTDLGAVVLGINQAEADSHRAFAEKFGFTFPLLTDRGSVVARQFRAAVQLPLKTLPIRTVYLINPERKVRLSNRGAPPASAIIRSIQALQQGTRRGM
jgi:peroxiredoxin Q/BCP